VRVTTTQIAAIDPDPRDRVDFHMHSTVSDGAKSPEQVLGMLSAHGVRAAAFTDHDDIAASRDPALVRAIARLGAAAPHMVPGVEITCWLDQVPGKGGLQELHMVGLGCNPRHPALRKALIRQRLGIAARVKACVSALRADGYDIRTSELGRVAKTKAVKPATIADLLVKRGYARDRFDALFGLVLPRLPQPGDIPESFMMTTERAIDIIHEAGGVAILAHPDRHSPSNDMAEVDRLFSDLRAQGLDAVEVYRTDVALEEQPRYAAAAKRAGLLASGGSDYHDLNDHGEGRYPGDANAPLELWPALERKIRERGGVTDVRDIAPKSTADSSASERFLLA